MTFRFQSSRPRPQMLLDSVADWPTRTVGPGARVERWRNRCPSSPAKYLTRTDVIDHHVVFFFFFQKSSQHSTKHKCTNWKKLFPNHGKWLNKLLNGGYGIHVYVHAEMLALPLSKELLLLASPRKTTTMPQAKVSTWLRSLGLHLRFPFFTFFWLPRYLESPPWPTENTMQSSNWAIHRHRVRRSHQKGWLTESLNLPCCGHSASGHIGHAIRYVSSPFEITLFCERQFFFFICFDATCKAPSTVVIMKNAS